jgi:hypothetical protein
VSTHPCNQAVTDKNKYFNVLKGGIVMVCNIHPNRQAASTCYICGQPFCEECLVQVNGKWYCKEHVAALINTPPSHIPYREEGKTYDNPHYSAPQGQQPPQSPYYGGHYQYNYYGPTPGYYPYQNKVIALLLCIFLGWGGFHRFYVGKIGTGLLWLCTGGFFLIGWLVDTILIAVGSFRDKRGYPLI